MIYIGGILAMLIFAYMRNKQASRNDKRRERLWEMQERLNETLRANREEPDNNKEGSVNNSGQL